MSGNYHGEFEDKYHERTRQIPKLQDDTLIVSRPPNRRVAAKKPKVKKQPIHKVELVRPVETGAWIALGILLFFVTVFIGSWALWGIVQLATDGWTISN